MINKTQWYVVPAALVLLFGGGCETLSADTADTPDSGDVPTASDTRCEFPSGLHTLYEESFVIDDATGTTTPCGFGEVCFQEEAVNDGVAACSRSIDESQAEKPYYDFGCASFSLWVRHPTKLEIDCRCRVTGDGQGGAGGEGNAHADPNNIDINNGGRPGGPIINCKPQSTMQDEIWPVDYGTGPSFNAWFQVNASGASWFSGTVRPSTREMFAIVKWTDPNHVKAATVVAWNIDTGDRRVVSGIHPTEGDFGSGYLSPIPQSPFPFPDQPLTGANVIQFGPDGNLYTYGGGTGESTSAQREIVRIDPDTGERTLVWLGQRPQNDKGATDGFAQCLRPDAYGTLQTVGLNGQAFAMGDDGSFYMAFHGGREGDGIIRISPDAQECKVITRWSSGGHNPGGTDPVPALEDIGDGPAGDDYFDIQFFMEGLLVHDGRVYAVANDEVYSFDLTTGDREFVTHVGTPFSGMGIANMFWDDTRDVIWAVGNHAPFIGAIVDPATGRRESVFGDTGKSDFGDEAVLSSVYNEVRSVSSTTITNGNSLGNGGFILDPENNDIAYAVLKSGGLLKLELSTFNNYVMSW